MERARIEQIATLSKLSGRADRRERGMRLLEGRGGVRRGSWPPFHRIRLLLSAMITSLGQTSTARDIFLSLSIYLHFFPNLFLSTFLSLSLLLSILSPLFCRAKSISRSRFIRSVPYSPDFSALEEGGGDSSSPDALRIRFSRSEAIPSSSDFTFLLIIF